VIREGRAAEAVRLDIAIARIAPDLSRSRAAALIKQGAVSVDGVTLHRPSAVVPAGAALVVDVPEPAPAAAQPQDLPIRIVFEDADLLVIDKDAGMVVHPAPGHPDGTLVNALLHHVDDLSGVGGVERPGIVHRLDRGTSGLLVVAKNDLAHRNLQAQFASHTAGRRYLALVAGVPAEDSGTIRSLLGRHATDRMRFASGARGREAITHWTVRARAGSVALIECKLETGRTHQVRIHLSEQRWPIIGDPLYGGSPKLPVALRAIIDPKRPLLHAWQLAFVHPDGRPLRFVAPLPDDFLAALAAVELEAPDAP
jgi:23S rRNA pseudouridine1911/1915/1917 synthase